MSHLFIKNKKETASNTFKKLFLIKPSCTVYFGDNVWVGKLERQKMTDKLDKSRLILIQLNMNSITKTLKGKHDS